VPEDHVIQLNIRSDSLVLKLEIQDRVIISVVGNGREKLYVFVFACDDDIESHGRNFRNRSCSFSSWNGIRCANRFASRS